MFCEQLRGDLPLYPCHLVFRKDGVVAMFFPRGESLGEGMGLTIISRIYNITLLYWGTIKSGTYILKYFDLDN